MYSVVLLAALATQPSAPAWGHGCHGCCGGGWSSCHGCHSCSGCHGCCGGCWSSGYGCGGGCYGCGGGCYGCGGGCWSSGYGSGYGCGCGGWYSCHGCYGCYGCYGCGGGCYGGYGVPVAPAMPAAPAGPAEPAPKPKLEKGDKDASLPRAGKLVVELPADAKLFIDDQAMKTTADKRSFNTPVLQPNQQYFYDLRAEVVRDGKTYTETRRVIVKAGETAKAAFPELQNAGIKPDGKPVAAAK